MQKLLNRDVADLSRTFDENKLSYEKRNIKKIKNL